VYLLKYQEKCNRGYTSGIVKASFDQAGKFVETGQRFLCLAQKHDLVGEQIQSLGLVHGVEAIDRSDEFQQVATGFPAGIAG
jgi:hypothetical protein